MADNRPSAAPRRAMGAQQHGRVDFESPRGIVRDIGGGQYVPHPPPLAQQQAANLAIGGSRRVIHYPREKRP